jgi:very-short-patch-repair endonuclease
MKQSVFFKKVKKIYGDKFDMSQTIYKNTNTKIDVICPIHGKFTVSPTYFLQGYGCLKCNHHNEFIENANKIHGNKYDYSKVIYEHCNKKVCIICPKHGEFYQKPSHHLNGCGCQQCGKDNSSISNSLTLNDFISKATGIHGNKYDYSKVVYETWDKEVTIICPEHGVFLQKPAQHLRGAGCLKCHNEKQRLINENNFKEFMIQKFGDIIDFSEMKYQNLETPVILIYKPNRKRIIKSPQQFKRIKVFYKEPKKEVIIENSAIDYKELFLTKINLMYPERFDFTNIEYKNRSTPIKVLDKLTNNYVIATPYQFLRNDILKLKGNETYNFIQKGKKIHGDKYDYSNVIYKGTTKKLCIICPEHGEFYQTPNSHLKGSGCPKCAGNVKWEYNDFLDRVTKIHNNKYKYDKTHFQQICDKITVTCPIHGDFVIRGHVHLNGGGCQKCVGSGGEKIIMHLLDSNKIQYEYNKFYSWLDNLQLDFYIPEYKLAIEVQGEQHFRETNFLGELSDIQKRDTKKMMLCQKNGITLLYFATYMLDFPYKVYTDLIELYDEIKKHGPNYNNI